MADDAPKPDDVRDDLPPVDEAYPSQCPACQEHAAKPKSVSTVKGQELTVRLDMLCGHCAHQWTYDKLLPHDE